MSKRTKTIVVFKNEVVFPENIDGFMAFWQKKIDLIPDDFKDSAKIFVEPQEYYGDLDIHVTIIYHRLETDEEEIERIEDKKQKLKELQKAELYKYEELKAKYGGLTWDT